MSNKEWESLLKPGAELKAYIIDENDPEFKAMIQKCIEEQERCYQSRDTEPDWNMRITI